MTTETERFARVDAMPWFDSTVLKGKRVAIVGLGAIGSHFATHLARCGVSMVLIDPDRCEIHNLASSEYRLEDVGAYKCDATAARLRAINPDCDVEYVIAEVNEVGLAMLAHVDLIIGAVDSRLARSQINRIALLLGKPYLDGACDGASLTGRVQLFLPAPDAPCLECGWSSRTYELLEHRYPCSGNGVRRGAPTLSTIAAATASLMANEAIKFLLDMEEYCRPGRELRIDLMHHVHTETVIPRNRDCLADHGTVITETVLLPGGVAGMSLGDLFSCASRHLDSDDVTLHLRREFATSLFCEDCGVDTRILCRPDRPVPVQRCPDSHRTYFRGFTHSITREECDGLLNLRLEEIGIPRADIIEARAGDAVVWLEFPGSITRRSS